MHAAFAAVTPRPLTARRMCPPFDSAARKLLVCRQQAAHPLCLGGHLGLHLRWLWLELGPRDLSGTALAARGTALAAAALAAAANVAATIVAIEREHPRGDHHPRWQRLEGLQGRRHRHQRTIRLVLWRRNRPERRLCARWRACPAPLHPARRCLPPAAVHPPRTHAPRLGPAPPTSKLVLVAATPRRWLAPRSACARA